jgi:hypothetical protein
MDRRTGSVGTRHPHAGARSHTGVSWDKSLIQRPIMEPSGLTGRDGQEYSPIRCPSRPDRWRWPDGIDQG